MSKFVELDAKAKTDIGGERTPMNDALLRVVDFGFGDKTSWDDHRVRQVLLISVGDDRIVLDLGDVELLTNMLMDYVDNGEIQDPCPQVRFGERDASANGADG